MIIDQSHESPLMDIFDKYFPEQDDLLNWEDFGQRKVDSEKFKVKVMENIEALQNVLKDIKAMELTKRKESASI